MANQVQCPHCNGYNVSNVTQTNILILMLLWGIGGAFVAFILAITISNGGGFLAFLVYVGGFVAILLPFARRTRRLGVLFQCANPACGKKWTEPAPPIKPIKFSWW